MLEDRARELVSSIEELNGVEAKGVREHYGELLSANPSTQALAVASKLDIILTGSGPATGDQLQVEAKKYGWPMSQNQVQDGIEFLFDKGFADPA